MSKCDYPPVKILEKPQQQNKRPKKKQQKKKKKPTNPVNDNTAILIKEKNSSHRSSEGHKFSPPITPVNNNNINTEMSNLQQVVAEQPSSISNKPLEESKEKNTDID